MMLNAVRSALLVLMFNPYKMLPGRHYAYSHFTGGNTESNLPMVTQLESELGSLTSWLPFETAPYSMWDRIRTRLWSRQAATL